MNFLFVPNIIYEPVLKTDYDICDIWGGRGRGGSHFATDLFLFKITQPYYFRGYFMRFIHGDIRNSLYQDFKDRVEEHEEINYDDFDFNDSRLEVVYRPTGNKILSKGFRKSQGSATAKLKSIAGATDILIEECEEIDREDFNKLQDSLRTTKADVSIYRVFNPPPKYHWIIKDYYNIIPLTEHDEPGIDPEILEGHFIAVPKGIDGHLSIFSTYEQNITNINKKTIARFKAYKKGKREDVEHYLTDIKGYVSGGAKGLIYKHFKKFDKLPEDMEFYRMLVIDFGHTDPFAILELNFNASSKRVYVRELCYRTHLATHEMISIVKENNINNDEVICDSARPDKIQDLQIAGINAFGAKKGADSIVTGIDNVKEYEIYYDGKNIEDEKNKYKWAVGANKEPTGKPEDKNNHALDGLRYGVDYYHYNYGIYEEN